MIISFAGHSAIEKKEKVKFAVKEQLRPIISQYISITFYLGGYGDFDEICACACRELKRDLPNIELVYVTPYNTLSEQAKIKELLRLKLYDSSLYPPLEGTINKFAILNRNKWMMSNADLIITYIQYKFGGAYKSVLEAQRRKKKIINIFEIINSSAENQNSKNTNR